MQNYLTHPLRLIDIKWLAVGSTLLGLSMAASGMDLLQAFEAAQQNDATILAARATANMEQERVPQARAQLLPNLSANVSRTNNQLTSVTPNFLGVEQTTESNYPSSSQSLTLRQPLFRPQLTALYRQSKAQVDDADATLLQEEQNLVVRVSSAYFEAMLTHDQLALISAQQTAYASQLDSARKRFTAGSGTRTDIDEALALLDMNLAQEIEARQNVTYTRQQLEALVNQPIDKLSTLDIANLTLDYPNPNNLDDWTSRVENHNPQLQSLKARVQAAREEIRKMRAGHYPTLDAVAQYSDSKSESVTSNTSRYINRSFGFQLNIPLFAGGAVNSQVRQSLANLERVQQVLEAGRRDLQMRVFKEFRGVTENIPKIQALEQALRSADQLVLSSRKSFEAGSRTVIDILNAEKQRVSVQRDLAQARYVYLISKIKLLALVGEADVGAVVAVNAMLKD